jgi:hypothetical protein
MSLPEARGLFMRYMSFLFLLVAALIGSARICRNSGSVESKSTVIVDQKGQKKKKKDGIFDPSSVSSSIKTFQGGVFEASGVVSVPGTDGVLIVDDGRADEVLWMRIDQDGNQVGAIKPVKLGVSVIDKEGITFDGAWFYVVGSQSILKEEEPHALVRFTFDPETLRVSNVESAGGLYKFLTREVAELNAYAGMKGKREAFNIEGLAWDPVQERLLLGFRDPLISGAALVVALRLQDPNAPLSLENLTLAEPYAYRLALGGLAIRSIEYDGGVNLFQIIAGAPEAVKSKTEFKLWEWDGGQYLAEKATLDYSAKPEGVTRISRDGHSFLFFVCDLNRYFKLDE